LSYVAESDGLTSKADVKVLIERMVENDSISNIQNSIHQIKSQSFVSPSQPLIADIQSSEAIVPEV
jgi:hypothetical protein